MVIDAMGHYSPIVKQLRKDQEPSSVCMVVGGSASYNNAQKGALVLATTNDCEDDGYQNYWQSFPSFDGTTNYMFTYLDLKGNTPKLSEYIEDYLKEIQNFSKDSIRRD